MQMSSQVNTPKNRIMLEFQSEITEGSYTTCYVWMTKEQTMEVIALLKRSLTELVPTEE